MTTHTADVPVQTGRRGGVPRGVLLVSLLLLGTALAGCSAAIYSGYLATADAKGYAWEEVTALETRGAVRATLGEPAETFACAHGIQVERYAVPAKMDACRTLHMQLEETKFGCSPERKAFDTFYIALASASVLGLGEVYLTPRMIWAVNRTEAGRGTLHVTVVYDSADRVLTHYKVAPDDQDGVVRGPLTQQVRAVIDTPTCPRWRECLGRGVADLRQRAACLNYTLPAAVTTQAQWVEQVAEQVDDGRLTEEQGRRLLKSCYLEPCPAATTTAPPLP